jgi:predicted lipoprotein with Yx(FWY)xxD motif
MKHRLTLFIAAAAALTIALVAAGCGSSATTSGPVGPYGSANTYGSAVAPSAPNGAARAANVKVASSGLGHILVDSAGHTLYLFEKDTNGRSACYGQCATYWPPLLTAGKPLAQAGANQQLVGTTRRADGSEQVTYAGHPLYLFLLDKKPGQTSGEGSQDFGAGWDVLSHAGNKIEADG